MKTKQDEPGNPSLGTKWDAVAEQRGWPMAALPITNLESHSSHGCMPSNY